MTDEFTPRPAGAPDAPDDSATEQPVYAPTGQPPDAAAAAAAAAPKSGGRRTFVVIGVIVAFLAIVLFVVRNNVAADDLKVGDCFTIPNGTTIATVEKHACTEVHNAEVIFVGDFTGESYPIAISLDSFVEDNCISAFESYVGRGYETDPELSIGYFHPTRDGWDSGDKTITCYIAQPDESEMTESLKAS